MGLMIEKSLREAEPLFYNPFPLSFEKERGIKRVPRKIEDFPGCLKGVR